MHCHLTVTWSCDPYAHVTRVQAAKRDMLLSEHSVYLIGREKVSGKHSLYI